MAEQARGLGPGPVFVYEWITGSRRWQTYAMRSIFVLGLLIATLFGARSWSMSGAAGTPTIAAMAALGEKMFVSVVGTQLVLVLLAAPAATAGSICLDRSRGSLTHLLVTDLSDAEIVLGKLAARLAPVLTLVAATLPFLGLLTLLGGVDPDALLGAFLVTLGVAALGCTLALVFSMWVKRVHEAMLATYAVWGAWLLGRPMLDELSRVSGLPLPEPPIAADPFWLTFAPYWRPGSVGPGDFLAFLAVTWGISAALALFAVSTLRRACLRESARRSGFWKPRWASALSSIFDPIRRAYRRMGPSLDGNPVYWREWHRNRPPIWARIVAILYLSIAFLFSAIAASPIGGSMLPPWVNAFQVSIGFLFLSVIAATSLAEERVRGSLDVLLTTPIESRQIVLGKWLGTFRLVPPMAILPTVVIFSNGQRLGLGFEGAVLMIGFVLAAGAAITSLGLAMATWSARLGRAVGLTVSLYLLAAVGWMFAVFAMSGGRNSEFLAMGSPFFWGGAMTDAVFHGPNDKVMSWGLGWIIFYAIAATFLLGATLASFDRCLGRIEEGEGLSQGRMSPTAIRPTSVPSITTGTR